MGTQNITYTTKDPIYKQAYLFLYMEANIWTKKDENGEWTWLHNKELHSLYRSPTIVRVIEYRRLRWAGHVARMKKVGVLSKQVHLQEKDLQEGLGVDGKTILEWILNKWVLNGELS